MNYLIRNKACFTRAMFTVFTLVLACINSHAQTIKLLERGRPCSIRGLSVVNDKVAWVSGSNGYVGRSIDAGLSWQWQQVKGFEKSDFRDVEAFSDRDAVIMSSGTPALIMQTHDGGMTWQINYRNDDNACFLDAMDFYDRKHGVVLGDPIDNKFLLLETQDGGRTWKRYRQEPAALPGEAAFAASGTCMAAVAGKGNVAFVTGGKIARLITRQSGNWLADTLLLTQGADSEGAFAFAAGGGYEVVVGGDYKHPDSGDSTACYRQGNGSHGKMQPAVTMPGGYQSGICWLGSSSFLSTGTSGSNISIDGGINWKLISTENFNVCKRAKHGNLALLAGDNGRIAVFEIYSPHN